LRSDTNGHAQHTCSCQRVSHVFCTELTSIKGAKKILRNEISRIAHVNPR
jgi:hypothetical protein